MKVLAELRSISGTVADVYIDNVLITPCYAFAELPKGLKEAKEIEISKILKLKEAGFDTEDLIKMKKEGML